MNNQLRPNRQRKKRSGIQIEDWSGSCVHSEFTLHQVAPYIGKMKSSMARSLINYASRVGDRVFDPFCGAGTVALEAALAGRSVIASDISPYAVLLTKAKLFAPGTVEQAISQLEDSVKHARLLEAEVDTRDVPKWVSAFFNRKTLIEALALARVLKDRHHYFLLACLLGILHHQRPGFLSYPASHLVPYLREKNFPRDQYPDLYKYREVGPRLSAKIRRSYQRHVPIADSIETKCYLRRAQTKLAAPNSIDAIITSPPYMNALDYGRDNRLRLWFLGRESIGAFDGVRNLSAFRQLMVGFFKAAHFSLKPSSKCILVVGSLQRGSKVLDTSEVITDLVAGLSVPFVLVDKIKDSVPDIRRARRNCSYTKHEWIMIFERG